MWLLLKDSYREKSYPALTVSSSRNASSDVTNYDECELLSFKQGKLVGASRTALAHSAAGCDPEGCAKPTSAPSKRSNTRSLMRNRLRFLKSIPPSPDPKSIPLLNQDK